MNALGPDGYSIHIPGRKDIEGAGQPADAAAAPLALDDRSGKGFAVRWLGVRDLMRAHVAVVLASRDRERRGELHSEIARLDGRLMLIDFGSARIVPAAVHSEITPDYAAPELWQSLEEFRAAAMAAAAAVAFATATGSLPASLAA